MNSNWEIFKSFIFEVRFNKIKYNGNKLPVLECKVANAVSYVFVIWYITTYLVYVSSIFFFSLSSFLMLLHGCVEQDRPDKILSD